MLDIIDDFLLVKMQKFTDWVQQVFGVVQYDIHKWVVIFGSVFYWMFALETLSPFFLLLSFLLSLLAMFRVRLLEEDKRNWMAGRQTIRYNWGRTDSKRKKVLLFSGLIFIPSCIILFLLLHFVTAFWLSMFLLFDVIETYLGACTPKPPGKSKIRESYKKLLAALNNALEPSSLAPVRR